MRHGSIHQIRVDKAECRSGVQRNGKTSARSCSRQGTDEHSGRIEAEREGFVLLADQEKLSAVGTPGILLTLRIAEVAVENIGVRVVIGCTDHARSEIRILKHRVDGWRRHGSLQMYFTVGERIRIRLNTLRPRGGRRYENKQQRNGYHESLSGHCTPGSVAG